MWPPPSRPTFWWCLWFPPWPPVSETFMSSYSYAIAHQDDYAEARPLKQERRGQRRELEESPSTPQLGRAQRAWQSVGSLAQILIISILSYEYDGSQTWREFPSEMSISDCESICVLQKVGNLCGWETLEKSSDLNSMIPHSPGWRHLALWYWFWRGR